MQIAALLNSLRIAYFSSFEDLYANFKMSQGNRILVYKIDILLN